MHGRIYGAMDRLIRAGRLADPITLMFEFNDDESLRELDGAQYLARLTRAAETILNVGDYGKIIIDLAAKRGVINASEELANQAYDPSISATGVDLISKMAGHARTLAGEIVTGHPRIDYEAWHDRDLPVQSWTVKDWLAVGYASSLYGRGGTGKSFIAQILSTCVATQMLWFGMEVAKSPVLAVSCEDNETDHLWRQAQINRALGVSFRDIGNVTQWCRLGEMNALMAFTNAGIPEIQPLFWSIQECARDIKAGLITIDNAGQTFAGNENDRYQVTAFLNALHGMAQSVNASVLFVGHPPANETNKPYSGSTAWHSNVRAMWVFNRDGEDEDRYSLQRFKSNHDRAVAEIKLVVDPVTKVVRPDDPAFETASSRADREQRQGRVRQHILDSLSALNARGDFSSHAPRAANYLPKVMAEHEMTAGFKASELRSALMELIAAGYLTPNATIGSYSNRTPRRGLVQNLGSQGFILSCLQRHTWTASQAPPSVF